MLRERGWRRPLLWNRDAENHPLVRCTWAAAKVFQPPQFGPDDQASDYDLICLPPAGRDNIAPDSVFTMPAASLEAPDVDALRARLMACIEGRPTRRRPRSILVLYDDRSVEAERLDAFRLFSRHHVSYLIPRPRPRQAVEPPFVDLDDYDAVFLDGSLDAETIKASPYCRVLLEFKGVRIALPSMAAVGATLDDIWRRVGVQAIVSGHSPHHFAGCIQAAVEFVRTGSTWLSDAEASPPRPLAQRAAAVRLRVALEPCGECGDDGAVSSAARLRRLCAMRGFAVDAAPLHESRAVIDLGCRCGRLALALEAARARTALVRVEGDGELQANLHYLPLRRDVADADAVLDRLDDPTSLTSMVERLHHDVVESATHGFQAYVHGVDRLVDRLLSVPFSRANAPRVMVSG